MNIEKIVFNDLNEVAYGTSNHYLFDDSRNEKVTIQFSVHVNGLKLEGFVELQKKEFEDNVGNLKEIIKKKIEKEIKIENEEVDKKESTVINLNITVNGDEKSATDIANELIKRISKTIEDEKPCK